MIDPSIPLGVRTATFNLGEMFAAQDQARQARMQGQQQRLGALKLREAEDEQADHDAIVQTLSKLPPGADGQPDFGAAAAALQSVRPMAAQKVREIQVKQAKAAEEAAQAKLKTESDNYAAVGQRGGLAYNGLSAALKDPAKYPKARADALKLMGEGVGEFLPAQFDKDKVQSAMQWWENTKPAIETREAVIKDIQARGFQQRDEEAGLKYWGDDVLTRLLPTASSQEEWQKAFSVVPEALRPKLLAEYGDTFSPENAKRAAVISMAPKERAELAGQAESRGLQAAGQAETRRSHLVNEANDRTRIANDEASTPVLTPEALDAVANQFAMTGQLPPMGMGSKAATLRSQVINRAAELFKGLDIPAQAAAFKANRDSLVKLQGMRDAVHSFESTAQKNIDVFLEAAGKVVDTGSPMVNSLARQVSGKMLGSENQAEYDAARAVVLPEIAKIINNPNLSGVLSDSARHEVSEFNPKDATLGQTVKVLRLLKRDMGNRMSSVDDEIEAVKGRIARPGSRPAAASTPANTSGSGVQVGDVRTKGGKKYRITAVHPDGTVDAEPM